MRDPKEPTTLGDQVAAILLIVILVCSFMIFIEILKEKDTRLIYNNQIKIINKLDSLQYGD